MHIMRQWRQCGLIGDDVSKHGSALFDELGAAAGAGDLDAAPAPGHPQLLAALGAAVVVVELAVVPLVAQAAEFAADAVLHGVVSIVLLGALGDVAAEHPVVAEAQQHHADIQQQRKPGEDIGQHQHKGCDVQKLVQAVGAVAADHELADLFFHKRPSS